jgi:hypothetical protein
LKPSRRLKMSHKSDHDNGKEQRLTDTKQPKKNYYKPQLQVYGNLREITQTFATRGKRDGGVSPPDRTHV